MNTTNTVKFGHLAISRTLRTALAAAGLFALSAQNPGHAAAEATIHASYTQTTLADLATDLQRQSGIEFKVPADISKDSIDRVANARTWPDALKTLLKGYNYLAYSGANGKLTRVTVTGRNGDGDEAAASLTGHRDTRTTENDLLAYRPGPVPDAYRQFPGGSVMPVTVPFDRLSKMKIGQKLPLKLPSGEYQAIHDNVFRHSNGDRTWVGYLDQQGKEYRVVITYGATGGVGEIVSPGGEYQIEQQNDANYLVDVGATGLVHGDLESDQALDGPEAAHSLSLPNLALSAETVTENPASLATSTSSIKEVLKAAGIPDRLAESQAAAGMADAGTMPPIIVNGVDVSSTVVPSIVDVMVVYTNGMDNANLDTRINQLFAVTNQAYIDSQIYMSLRFVGKTKVTYSDSNANTTALNDLTNGGNKGTGTLGAIKNLRTQLAADLVVLLRPYYKATQGNCGYTWVNGANGTALLATKGYVTVSDGVDRGGQNYYCNDYTFAHEVGHGFGNVHERGVNAPAPGAYPFAYGWGVEGTAGTIMSYVRPLVPYFANPNITCNGLACGVPTTATNSADNAATTNLTGNTVSKFFGTP